MDFGAAGVQALVPMGRRATSAPRRAPGAALAVLLLLAVGCADAVTEQRRQASADARAALDGGDPNGALAALRLVWDRESPDPSLALVGAEACLEIGRLDDALEFARAGLGEDVDDPDLRADLEWARGKAHLGSYHQLKREADLRAAKVALEEGTRGGARKGESAGLLAMAWLIGDGRDQARFERFGRLALEWAPESKEADAVRKAMFQLGIDP